MSLSRLLLILFLAAALMVPGASRAGPQLEPAPLVWEITCVDCPRWFRDLTDRSLRLDSAGRPHIVYGGEHLFHAWRDGETWRYETVDDTPGAGFFPALAFDAAGTPHIAYYGPGYETIKYTYRDAAGWHSEAVATVASPNYSYRYPVSLAVDTAGTVHLCFNGRNALKYASRPAGGSTWLIETVETGWDLYGSLAVDSQDRPHVSYGRDSLKHAVREDGVWQTETVENPPDSDVRGSSLVVDSAGRVHIGYAVEVYVGDSHVRLASLEASGWVTETVASGPEQATSSISLALDQSGSPYLSYGLIRWSGVYHYLLRVAWRGNAGWQQETVASHDNDRLGEDYRSSLAVDSAGRIHLAYQSVSGNYSSAPTLVGPLQYALADSAGWQRETVDRSAKAGLGSSLALDSAGRPVISYGADGLWLASFDAGQWDLAMLDPLGATATSLSLDPGGQRRIAYLAYYTRFQDPEPVELRLGQGDAGQWLSQVIDRPSGPDISLAVDAQGRSGIAYTYHDRLLYAAPHGSVWRSDLVDTDVAGGASLVMTADGAPHISYIRNGLRVATRDAAGWRTEIVHADSAWEGHSALAIDAAGQPHIGYYLRSDNLPRQLFYAVRRASGWQVEVVDGGAGEDVGRFVSLALDAARRPHLSYYDATSGALKYAWRDAAGWHVQTVDGDQETDVGQYTALVLDGAGRPIISYYDVTRGDLKVARLAAPQGSAMLPLVAVDRGGAP